MNIIRSVLFRDAPIIGIDQLLAVLPIIGIGRLSFTHLLCLMVWKRVGCCCVKVTIGRDVRGVASLAWGGVRGTGGDLSVIDHTAQPLHMPPRMCPSSMLNYTVWTAGFCDVSGTFCINR